MKKSSLLWLSVLSVIFLSYPLLAQDKNYYSNDLIEQVEHFAKESSFSQTYGPERYGSECHMEEGFTQHYPEGKYGPAGYGTETENEKYQDIPKNRIRP
jgi:hypothetical protein